jgi:hypothetical protein
MTTIFLTDEDYAVIKRGDPDELKHHFNGVRTEMVQQQITINTLTTDCRKGLERVQNGKQCQRKSP